MMLPWTAATGVVMRSTRPTASGPVPKMMKSFSFMNADLMARMVAGRSST